MLQRKGVGLRRASRQPEVMLAHANVSVATVDLADPATLDRALDGIDAVFLMWPFLDGPEETRAMAEPIAELLGQRVRRVVYLSSETVERVPVSLWGAVEDAVREQVTEWTMLRPTGFMRNAEQWADQVRRGSTVRWPLGGLSRPFIHEEDMAAVAVEALLGDDLVGAAPVLTGPAFISQAQQVTTIGEAIGRPVRWVELDREEVEQELQLPSVFLDGWEAMLSDPEPLTDQVQQILGRAPRSFREWADDNVELFR